MNIGDDERKLLLREIETLIDDFKTLRLAAAKGSITTERESLWSRSPIEKPLACSVRPMNQNGNGSQTSWRGLELKDIPPKTTEERQAAHIHYAKRSGEPQLNTAGESAILKSGWLSWHEIEYSGEHADAALDAIERANDWVRRRCRFIWQALFAGRGAIFRGYCWPDIVLEIATHGGNATMTKPSWRVEIGCVELCQFDDGTERLQATNERQRMSLSLEIWERRHDPLMKGLGPYNSITKADELFIGDDEPELMHCTYELKPFLRDSELALDWLRRRFEDPQKNQPKTKNQSKVGRPQKTELDATEKPVWEAWNSGFHQTYSDCDSALHLVYGTTERIVGNVQKRKKRANKQTK
jgi:hypothetical protein